MGRPPYFSGSFSLALKPFFNARSPKEDTRKPSVVGLGFRLVFPFLKGHFVSVKIECLIGTLPRFPLFSFHFGYAAASFDFICRRQEPLLVHTKTVYLGDEFFCLMDRVGLGRDVLIHTQKERN